ncbi:putative vacuolar protein sorting-associated protein Ist1 [Arabidopsis thaliana]
MFDGLFKPKFYTKCKSLVKITKTRVDTVKRKKNSVCKYLKNDIVDLLKNSLDYNAYGRAEGLIEEKRRLACYEFLEQFCNCVASNVSLLQKSIRCPDECREAISSLVYAAARVSEVPELRDLRSLFAERYGNTLDQFVNPEFVERFKAEPPSKEMKVELLQEIAREYSIKWDAKSLEQRLYTPPHHHHVHTETEEPKTEKTNNEPEKTMEKRSSLSFHGREDSMDDSNKSIMSTSEEDSMSTSGSCMTGPEDDPEMKPFYYRFMTPAPYTKPKIEKQESLPEKMTTSHLMDTESPTGGKPKPRSVRRRFANPPPEAETEGEALKLKVESKNMMRASESMGKASGEGFRRMSRRTASWQHKPSSCVPDFDEVAARVDALSRY